MEEYLAKLTTCHALVVEFRKYVGSAAGKKDKPTPATAPKMSKLSTAMKEYTDLLRPLPPAFREMDWQHKADGYAGKGDVPAFLNVLVEVEVDLLSSNPAGFFEDFITLRRFDS